MAILPDSSKSANKRKRSMRLRFLSFIFIIAFITFSVLLGKRSGFFTVTTTKIQAVFKNKKDTAEGRDKNNHTLDSVLSKCFEYLEVPKSQISRVFFPEDSLIEIKILVPKGKPVEWIIWYISSTLNSTGLRLSDSQYESEKKGAVAYFTPVQDNVPKLKIKIQRSSAFFSQTAKMAILVEDFGFEPTESSVGFLSFPEPLSVSMVSSRKLSTWTAQIANEYKKEILIMLPMEPIPKTFSRYDKTQIKLHYPEEKIKSIIKEATDALPSFAGFCNFYGSRVMQDSRVMQIVFEEVKKHHGYFVITAEDKKSVAVQLARKIKIPYEKIDYTINTDISAATIEDTLRFYAILAQNTGKVIIRGRASSSFITALQNTLPQLKQNGIRLVYISEILLHPQETD